MPALPPKSPVRTELALPPDTARRVQSAQTCSKLASRSRSVSLQRLRPAPKTTNIPLKWGELKGHRRSLWQRCPEAYFLERSMRANHHVMHIQHLRRV